METTPETMTIARKFCGPADSGNGGYVAGRLAQHLNGCAEVVLRKPPPLERTMHIFTAASGDLALMDGNELIAQATGADLDLDVPESPGFAVAEAASKAYSGFQQHSFPRCFVCGPERGAFDGLRIFAGSLPGETAVYAPWVPHAGLAEADGHVLPEIIWAALDCPGAFAIMPSAGGAVVVLGKICAELLNAVKPGEKYVVAGWPLMMEGRKFDCGTAIYDSKGICVARAKSRWIALRPQAD